MRTIPSISTMVAAPVIMTDCGGHYQARKQHDNVPDRKRHTKASFRWVETKPVAKDAALDSTCIYSDIAATLAQEGIASQMPRRTCPRHGAEHPCTCAMGNLYRFVEPVLLFLLKKKGRSYGYELAAELPEHALTDASIEAAALYKTLRQLEENDCVVSEWDVTGHGPAKRVYRLTPHGDEHLAEWITVLDNLSRSMGRFVRTAGKEIADESIRPLPAVLPKLRKGAVKTAL